ncbi:MAG: ACT domain-containing protein [Gemmatimonadaceae bacterium]|nr:ACT domain-containing protein [Gemmatimonadaceae bacterium]
MSAWFFHERAMSVCVQFDDSDLTICRLPPDHDVPPWAASGAFFSVTRSPDELSVVCSTESVPVGVRSDAGWVALRVRGTLPLDEVGMMAALAVPLARARIPLFPIATYDTDYLLIRRTAMASARDALRLSGFSTEEVPRPERESVRDHRTSGT